MIEHSGMTRINEGSPSFISLSPIYP